MVKCTSPRVTGDTATVACNGQELEISLYGTLWYTENDVTLKRVMAVRIAAISPDRGKKNTQLPITVTGSGFMDSKYSSCRFVASGAAPIYENIQYTAPTEVTCMQPMQAAEASYQLDFAIDGQTVTGIPKTYQIVGDATNITVDTAIVVPAENETYFTLSVVEVDSQDHKVGLLDTQPRTVRVHTEIEMPLCQESDFSWRSAGDGFPFPACRQYYTQLHTQRNQRYS